MGGATFAHVPGAERDVQTITADKRPGMLLANTMVPPEKTRHHAMEPAATQGFLDNTTAQKLPTPPEDPERRAFIDNNMYTRRFNSQPEAESSASAATPAPGATASSSSQAPATTTAPARASTSPDRRFDTAGSSAAGPSGAGATGASAGHAQHRTKRPGCLFCFPTRRR
jgi:hypothetical protein